MKIGYQRKEWLEETRAKSMKFWLKVKKDYESKSKGGKGLSVTAIADKYINPKTGKNYTRAHIYWILHKLTGQSLRSKKKASK